MPGTAGGEERCVVADELDLRRTGRPLRMIGVAMNITERKKNEAELSRLAAIGDAVQRSNHEPDGTMLTWNGGAERMYGYLALRRVAATALTWGAAPP